MKDDKNEKVEIANDSLFADLLRLGRNGLEDGRNYHDYLSSKANHNGEDAMPLFCDAIKQAGYSSARSQANAYTRDEVQYWLDWSVGYNRAVVAYALKMAKLDAKGKAKYWAELKERFNEVSK